MERGDTTADRQSAGFFGGGLKKGKRRLLVTLFGPDARESRRQAVENDAVDTDATVQRKTPSKKDKARKLNAAIQRGDVEELRGLINEETVDNEISECMRLSDLAAALGNTQFLQLAIELDAKINSKNSAGQVPIHYAFTSPDPPATVAFLLENGASTSIQFPNGDFLMHKACSDGATVLLELLLGYEADLNCIDHMKLTPLHRACINDLKDHAEIVIQAAPHLVNQQDTNGRSPLHIAVANQSIQLMKILLDRGAAIDKETSDGLTPIDLMMTSKNRGALRELIFYFTDKVSKDVKAHRVQELYRSKHFHKFLSLLQLIDSETHKCYYRFPDEHLQPEQELKLVEALLDLDEEHTQDVIEFQSRVMSALATEAIHDYTDNREIIDTIAIFTTKYILFREDVSLLQSVMKCGVLWEKVSSFLEQHIGTLYSKTSKDSSVISKLFTEHFLESGKKKGANLKKIALRISKSLSLQKLNADPISDDERLGIGNPVRTLVTWSILTGRLNCTLIFLSKVEFEIIPMCLLAAGILRHLGDIFGQPEMTLPAATDLANQCEMMACEAARRAMQVDTSDHKFITYKYLLQSMRAFGGLNCIHLAANCQCDTFLTLEVSQKAMDLMWYRYIGDMSAWRRELVVAMGIIPFNPLVPLLLYSFTAREESEEIDEPEKHSASKESFAIQDADDPTATMFSEDLNDPVPTRRGCFSNLAHIIGLYYYFYQIPCVKFRYITISHLLLIFVMSYAVLMDFTQKISLLEAAAYIIAFGFILEEIREFSISILHGNIKEYTSNKWNIFDGLASLFTILSLLLRIYMTLAPGYEEQFNLLFDDHVWFAARFFFGLSCLLMWVKLLNVARVHEYFGPKLTMISEMIIRDLVPFMYILIVYICSFGVLMSSLLYPNGYFAYNPRVKSTSEILKEMLHICFYSIFGEYHLDAMTGSGCEEVYDQRSNNTNSCPHPDSVFIVPYVLLPVYITITTILLLSLIVALFSKTIDQIDSNSRALWLFERFSFVNEYESYSALPPPLNVLDMTRQAVLKLFGNRFTARSAVESQMDFFDPAALVRHLINQAIGLRNQRQNLQKEETPSTEQSSEQAEMLTELHAMLMKIQMQQARMESAAKFQQNRSADGKDNGDIDGSEDLA